MDNAMYEAIFGLVVISVCGFCIGFLGALLGGFLENLWHNANLKNKK